MADIDELDWIEKNEPWRLELVAQTEKVAEVVKPNKELEVSEWFMDLIKIKGIGVEIAKDIGRIYDSKEELIKSLSEDKVPLRNDRVKLLKKHFGVQNE